MEGGLGNGGQRNVTDAVDNGAMHITLIPPRTIAVVSGCYESKKRTIAPFVIIEVCL